MSHHLWLIIWVSLKVALCTTLLVTIFSIAAAPLLVRPRWLTIKALELLIYVPMAMPPVALGYGLLLALGPRSAVGSFFHETLGLRIAFSLGGAVLASFMASVGIGLRSLRVALEQIDEGQGHVAALLGATKIKIYFHIILPQCRSAIFAGAILVFIRALGEFGATLIFAGNSLGETRTLALAIWLGIETPGRERESAVLVLMAALISLIALIGAELFLVKNKEIK